MVFVLSTLLKARIRLINDECGMMNDDCQSGSFCSSFIVHRSSFRRSRAISSAGAEWVRGPMLMRSTPVSAMARTVSKVTPPDASRRVIEQYHVRVTRQGPGQLFKIVHLDFQRKTLSLVKDSATWYLKLGFTKHHH